MLEFSRNKINIFVLLLLVVSGIFYISDVIANPLNIIILGKPGSGKGTISQLLVKELGYFHLSTGDLLRAECQDETILGKKINQYFIKKELVPDHLVIQLVEKHLYTLIKAKRPFILDGFPFNMKQLDFLYNTLIKLNAKENVIVIVLNVSNDIVINRILKRKTCEKCKQIYNDKFFPPKRKNLCDLCGGRLFVRREDNLNDIKLRLNFYRNNLYKIVPSIKKKFITYEIKSNLDILKCANEDYEMLECLNNIAIK